MWSLMETCHILLKEGWFNIRMINKRIHLVMIHWEELWWSKWHFDESKDISTLSKLHKCTKKRPFIQTGDYLRDPCKWVLFVWPQFPLKVSWLLWVFLYYYQVFDTWKLFTHIIKINLKKKNTFDCFNPGVGNSMPQGHGVALEAWSDI